jgi:predicted ATP-dependent serine protease
MLRPHEIESNLFRPIEAAQEARFQYLTQLLLPTGNAEIDEVLEGGLETGNIYLILGPAKSGKSSFIRCLGLEIAKKHPVLYINLEQNGRGMIGKIYKMLYYKTFRQGVFEDPLNVEENIKCLPDLPFYMAFWPEKLESKSFDTMIRDNMLKSIKYIRSLNEKLGNPIVILENLSDTYCDQISRSDNLTNVVTRTAQEIKNFCVFNDIAMFLSHHTAKIKSGAVPELDDVRDSKRVVDLAHSIFASYSTPGFDAATGREKNQYHFRYISGRGLPDPRTWDVNIAGINMTLTEKKYNQDTKK